MSYFYASPPTADFLTAGVLSRRVFGWLLDIVLIGLLTMLLHWLLILFGVLTLGIGFSALALLPAVPFLYNFLSLLSLPSATPGQRITGLTVRRHADLGPPGAIQALVYVVLYYATLAMPLLLLVALFTPRHRTLHDLLTGLVVVRVEAMEALTARGGI